MSSTFFFQASTSSRVRGVCEGRGAVSQPKSQVEMIVDSIHHGIASEERDNPYLSSSLRADERVNFLHFADHFSPAVGGDEPQLLLQYREREVRPAGLLDLPPWALAYRP